MNVEGQRSILRAQLYCPSAAKGNQLQVRIKKALKFLYYFGPKQHTAPVPFWVIVYCTNNVRGGSLPEIFNYLPDRGQFS